MLNLLLRGIVPGEGLWPFVLCCPLNINVKRWVRNTALQRSFMLTPNCGQVRREKREKKRDFSKVCSELQQKTKTNRCTARRAFARTLSSDGFKHIKKAFNFNLSIWNTFAFYLCLFTLGFSGSSQYVLDAASLVDMSLKHIMSLSLEPTVQAVNF